MASIGNEAFEYCSSLTDIDIPESVTSIENEAFYGCRNLTTINIPQKSKLTSIGERAFESCFNLTSINIPGGVVSIGERAFSSCKSLTTITIPRGVTIVKSNTFALCENLTTIILPCSLRSIYVGAFSSCIQLTDIYCYAESVPSTEASAFYGSYPEYATLHVPAGAINSYKSTAPWSSFGKIIALGASITEITLSESSATLTEGEEMTLTATITPDDAVDKSISWSSSNPCVATVDNTGKVTAIAPGTATITATANDGSGVSASCEVRVVLGKCDTPTISYEDGRFSLTCATEGVEIRTNVLTENDNEYIGTEFDYIPTHTFTAYATKENYENSDVATLTLCWIPCTEEHEEEEGTTGTLNIPSKPVLISTQGGTITLSGLAEGTAVAAYSTAGTLLATATATDGTATLDTNLEAGNIAIVKMGDYSIRIAIK